MTVLHSARLRPDRRGRGYAIKAAERHIDGRNDNRATPPAEIRHL
ncbi:hypothetical protein [Massilia sp. HP4]|nr:hypothetical protein [Massilia sp. HP4]